MSARLLTVVAWDVPDDVAEIRGSAEHNADPREVPVASGKVQVPIHSDTWGPGVKDASRPIPQRMWCFWVTTELHDTRVRLNDRVQAGRCWLFIWDEEKDREDQNQYISRWQAARNWKPIKIARNE